jgi:hypothetical protein
MPLGEICIQGWREYFICMFYVLLYFRMEGVLYLHVLYAFAFQHMPVGNKTVHNQWSAFVIEHMLLYLGNIWQKYASVLSKGIYFYMHC